MDFKQFYFSAQGRVNRKQFWLWLVLPVFVISVILGFIDMATGMLEGKPRGDRTPLECYAGKRKLAAACGGSGPVSECPILDALEHGGKR